MSATKIQSFLSRLEKYGQAREISSFSGDPWGGYTRFGFEVYYQKDSNNYRWDDVFDNGLNENITATYFLTPNELVIQLEKQNWSDYE